MLHKLVLAAAAALALTTVSAYRPGDEVCVVSPDNACPLEKLTPSTLDTSTLVYPGGKTRCAFDAFSTTNFTTNATYFFQVFPNQKKDTTKLMLYLQGGGACVDDDTCSFALQCGLGSSSTFTVNARAMSNGVLNRTDENNTFKDWNIVHVPYCTGDIHIGNLVKEPYEPIFASILGNNECLKQNKTAHHNGYENALSAFKWAAANYPKPEHIVLAGSSAGALGAQLFGKMISDLWKVEDNKIRYTIVADSYVGVVPEDKPASRIVDYFNSCTLDFGLSSDIEKKCDNASASVIDVIKPMIKATPFSDWLFIDSKADVVQRKFFELFDDGILGYPFTDLLPEDQFFGNMSTIIEAYKSASSRVSAFFVEGDHHVFLNLVNWYSTTSTSNQTLGAVMRDVLEGNYTRSSSSSSQAGSAGSVNAPAPSSATIPVVSSALILALFGVLML
ncbi:hypothetical protein Poli38472_004500 [Pythium oligandrum]|uniref:Pectin acetylesterase n=1 Tax=Pythium oligandrum TaxID=41045 RepID=A0A8K1FEH7_PYTOL|nr:hypothetical protein Poli38472_004500 [Pythium oligandrum]|eukprot:TMW59431.1 hypothetical protein Poli38472_004500 [Pythium oligandrum]